MREIKFRQRNKNNGQWHYWGIIKSGNMTKWVQPLIQDNYGEPNDSHQFTGLKAKNGEIYEGDILKYSIYDEDRTGVVKYEDKWAQFYLSTVNKHGVGVGLTSVHAWYYNTDDDGTGVEIIGNIYENPPSAIDTR